jgi:hypothetical protein
MHYVRSLVCYMSCSSLLDFIIIIMFDREYRTYAIYGQYACNRCAILCCLFARSVTVQFLLS